MITSIFSYVFGYFFLIILLLLSIIFVIVKWHNDKLRSVFIVTGVISLFSIYFLLQAGAQKAVDTVKKFKPGIEEKLNEVSEELEKSKKGVNNIQKKKLAELSEQPRSKVQPFNFYDFEGELDWSRVPIVHPYSLNSIDNLNSAYLANESAVENELYSTSQQNKMIHDIEKANFNKDIILLKTTGEYHIVFRKDNSIKTFDSYGKLLDEAIQNGWSEDEGLKAISKIFPDYWVGFSF